MFKNVLLCYDGTVHGRRALKRGADLAIFVRADVHVLSIRASGELSPAVAAAAAGHVCLVQEPDSHEKLLEDSIRILTSRGVNAKGYLAYGNIIEQIVLHAKRLAVDLIVLGHYPREQSRLWWSGPERASLAEQVNCCIFVAVGADDPGSTA